MFEEVTSCAVCGNPNFVSVLRLGNQYLTGVFPRNADHKLTCGPLELVKCHREDGLEHCGLVQLRHAYEATEMYGEHYGYRSSLNASMATHLGEIVRKLQALVSLGSGDLVLDIGSNDGTLLSHYPAVGPELVGIDPTSKKFARYFKPHIRLIPELFSAKTFRSQLGDRRAKIITSIAMFYDIPRPLEFMREVHEILADDGIWHFEQSYLPAMLQATAYDTICHEHLEYYALRQIKYLTDRAGLKIIDVQFNDINGGSFAITVAKRSSIFDEATADIDATLSDERALGLDSCAPYEAFRKRIDSHRHELTGLLRSLKSEGRTVLGYGASTKGNVILQYCGLSANEIPAIAEVNEEKFGCVTPGTHIPIISEAEAHAMRPDYFVVLPWHFRQGIVRRERAFLQRGGKLIFPLPRIEIECG